MAPKHTIELDEDGYPVGPLPTNEYGVPVNADGEPYPSDLIDDALATGEEQPST